MLHRWWPAPALLVWVLAWALCLALREAQAPLWATLALPAALGLGVSTWSAVASTRWRSVFVAAGFPLSVLAQAWVLGHLDAWAWLIPLGVLLLAYPVRAWRDAPLFPTPVGALDDLPHHVRLPEGAAVLDAGCGLGDGLKALHRAYPDAWCHGTEWSWPLALACRLRCPWAQVGRGDLWAQDWSPFALVYLFQRPESMPQALAKARREMRPGTCLVSLEFEAPPSALQGMKPPRRLDLPGGRPIWIYRL